MAVQSDNPPEISTLQAWKGLNQQARRGSIDDEEEFWNENLFAIGAGNLRSCWGHGPAIYTAPAGKTILRIFFGFIGNETPQFYTPPPGRLGWMFLSDGTIDQVDLDTRVVTPVHSTKFFSYDYEISDTAPASGVINQTSTFTQLVVNNTDQTGTDNTAFLSTVAVGSNITTNALTWTVTGVSSATGITTFDITPAAQAPPTGVTAFAFTTNVQTPVWEPIAPEYWASAKVWRPQYFGNVAGQVGGVLFGSPQGLYAWDGTNLYAPGDNAPDWLTDQAESTPEAPPTIMPDGLPGIYAMEVYQERLWVAGRDVISYSAPSNGADFSTTDGGGSFGYFGDRLVYAFQDLAQSAGYLYVFGDSSTDVITNVQLTGSGSPESPYTTAFNYSNLDPQVGQRFPRPVGRMGRHFVHWNGAGIFLTTGGDAQPIGDKVTNTYLTLDTSQYLPTMATATMFNFRVILCNGRFTDPFGVTRSMMLMWHPVSGNPFWSIASQGLELTNIGYYEQDSICTPYGTDGNSLYELFAQPDPALIKKLSTKALRGLGVQTLTIKNFKRLYLEVHDNDGRGVALTGTMTCGGGSVPGGTEDIGFQLTAGEKFNIIPQPIQGQGIWGEIDLESLSPDFTLERLHIAAEARTLYGA